MKIAIVENGNVAKIGTLQECFPNVSFTTEGPDEAFFAANNVKKIAEPPAYDRSTEKLVDCQPYISGDFVQIQEVTALTSSEKDLTDQQQSAYMRRLRNAKLVASDYTQLPDAPVDAVAWAAYRQALRDITENTGFPWDIIWPDEPEA